MFKRRETMREQAWSLRAMSRRAIAGGAVALVLVAAVLIPIDAGAYPFRDRITTAHLAGQETKVDDPIEGAVEPAPTDDGSIIVECVALAAVLNAHQGLSSMSLAAVPRNPLGPLMCWPNDNRNIR